jgi:hypothetical protein
MQDGRGGRQVPGALAGGLQGPPVAAGGPSGRPGRQTDARQSTSSSRTIAPLTSTVRHGPLRQSRAADGAAGTLPTPLVRFRSIRAIDPAGAVQSEAMGCCESA